jgi:hypothetical protein
MPRIGGRLHLLSALALLAVASRGASAHQGPPFPLLVDAHTATHIVSVWADPDIGEAQFFVTLETLDGEPAEGVSKVSMWVEPLDGRLVRATYDGARQNLRNQVQYAIKPYFDQQDKWRIGVRIETPGQEPEELTMETESTPPGLGKWDLALYSFPFLLVGGLWALVVLRRHTSAAKTRHSHPTASPPA